MSSLTHKRISYPKDITKKTVTRLSVYRISTFKLTEIKSVVYTFLEALNTYSGSNREIEKWHKATTCACENDERKKNKEFYAYSTFEIITVPVFFFFLDCNTSTFYSLEKPVHMKQHKICETGLPDHFHVICDGHVD